MAIMFSAMAVGQASSFAPDYGKAKTGASLCFTIWDRVPLINSNDETGEQPVCIQHVLGAMPNLFSIYNLLYYQIASSGDF